MNRETVDPVPLADPLGRGAVHAAHPAGAAGTAAGPAGGGRPAPDGQGRGDSAGDQPQHRSQGLSRARIRGTGGGPARGRDVRDQDPDRRLARRARTAPRRTAAMARQGPPGRSRQRQHRGPVPDHLPGHHQQGDIMTAVLESRGLGKRYRRRWALTDCTLSIPAGRVTGLVGPNGAGKTTLLHMATGMLVPTTGTITVLGGQPASGPDQLAKVGFVAQEAPTYAGLSVADHLKLGARLNPGWDAVMAQDRITRLGLDPAQKAGKLSGGQRAQLALTLAIAKKPQLLMLDEPIASLDPLARREFLQVLMEFTAEQEVSVVMSSHLMADLERVCDYLIVLMASKVRLTGPVDELVATHYRLTGPRCDPAALPPGWDVIEASHTDRQSTLLVRTDTPVMDQAWTVDQVDLEDLVLAYMAQAPGSAPGYRRAQEAQR